MDLKIEYLDKDYLKPYENNAKIHTQEQIEQIKNSIKEFGMNDPIAIWKNNVIIEGHGRFIACRELGIDKIPVIRLDELTDEQRKAYALVHNKLTMNTDFEKSILTIELDSINDIDMTEFGFDNDEEMDDLQLEETNGELKFVEFLDEESNYIVLKFNNRIDWIQMQSIFDIKRGKLWSTRKDGKTNRKMQQTGIGHVVDGTEFLNKIFGDVEVNKKEENE